MQRRDIINIRDPIHGSIVVSIKELKLIDQPAFQRLRNIKQLGFADLAFPGGTHTRYSHSLGAMHVATQVFDRLFQPGDLPEDIRLQYRQLVRLAMLFHDIGHAPLSHTTEMLMPKVGALSLTAQEVGPDLDRQATHEDYTLKLLIDSPLTATINQYFSGDGISPRMIAGLIFAELNKGQYKVDGLDYGPILRQIVTSECDADRMDYLQRDSFFCGVSYGKFDAQWLIDNVIPVQQDGAVFLGLQSRAIFSFEDFLLSRYHMFASVYFHHTPVIFEKLLEKYMAEEKNFQLPHDIEAYVALDDVDFWHRLRKSTNPWAKRIVNRKPFYLLDESRQGHNDGVHDDHHTQLCERLSEKNIELIATRSRSVLSKYFGHGKIPIYVCTNAGQLVGLEQYTPLYQRYQSPALIDRIYIAPENREAASVVLNKFVLERYPNGKKG